MPILIVVIILSAAYIFTLIYIGKRAFQKKYRPPRIQSHIYNICGLIGNKGFKVITISRTGLKLQFFKDVVDSSFSSNLVTLYNGDYPDYKIERHFNLVSGQIVAEDELIICFQKPLNQTQLLELIHDGANKYIESLTGPPDQAA
ncbi:MAG: hypothetical protein HON90_10870 [Halobacteriovoraceae bacterium]|mgnify:CR=1 FL=1|jgi:hypothetical protein|nr:hypothetical protein [Halobacteriovoraceae bacterium]